ncbi:PAS domain-containing protein [Sphingomonas alba]|uniref:PAS domain-containing protein n=1 Tax=Sphingomonas alba TaxID=2908208 RepID=A0ABT0RLU5_9SPHN|nr:hypothetical protein [Sphingomonas alba]MCL6683575.1 hypothetical protein [Sphingomonas alba]
MDSFSDYSQAFDAPVEPVGSAGDDATVAIGTDERRMHVRAYNYWVSLLDGRDYPSIEDLDPANITDFAQNSVLLDFTGGRDNPATPYIGAAIRSECDLGDEVASIDQVPSRSLLSRLTDHYMQIIANRAPVGFEAEFVNQRGHSICYRGILMPFSSDGDTIDFIYGVINWKDAGDAPVESPVLVPALAPLELEQVDELDEEIEDEEPLELDEPQEIEVEAEAGLADRLWAARESAEICKQADGRSRAALYRTLAMAYDFAVATKRVPDEYSEILDDAGVKAQARAPMTPIVKLVFGVDYDKTRLTEFASALSHAERCKVEFGGFLDFVEQAEGGLKGLVAAERKARRPDLPVENKSEIARSHLRAARGIALSELPTNQEFALVVTRRNAAGVHEVVALVTDESLLDRALRRTA